MSEPSRDPRRGFARYATSLRVRIVAAFLAALTAMGVSVGYLVVQQQPVADSLELVAQFYLRVTRKVARLRQDQERVQRDLQRINKGRTRPVTEGTSAAEIYTDELRERIANTRTLLDEAGSFTDDAEQLAFIGTIAGELGQIEQLFSDYEAQSSAYLDMVAEGRKDEAQDVLGRPMRNTGKSLEDEFAKIETNLDARVRLLTEESRRHQSQTTAVALRLAGAAAGFSFVLVVTVLYALRPIIQLTEQVQRLAAGDYGGRVAVSGADEIALLAAEINEMALAIETRDARLKERAAELRQLSRYLASVLDSLVDGLVVVESGRVTLTNPAAVETWGAVVGEEPPEQLAEAVVAAGLHDLAGAAGKRYLVRTVPYGEEGRVSVVSDVTDQVRAQEALARTERLALVGQMLAQITHEVRNPLNALSLNAELLGDEVTQLDPERNTEAWDILAMIAGEVERLTEVTGHYLQLARRPPARLVSHDLSRVVEEVARLLEPELQAEGAALRLSLAEVSRQLVDGNQLRQALLNVVRNAVEAGARELELTLAEEGGTEVVLALRDNGPGMDDEQIARAFDPFFSTKATGTGLGLAITRQILEDHGGRVRVDSVVGRGTRVALVLPARPTDDEAVDLVIEETI